MRLSAETKIALFVTTASIVAGGLVAKYGGEVIDFFTDSQPQNSQADNLNACDPNSVDIESARETAGGSNLGISPNGTICLLKK